MTVDGAWQPAGEARLHNRPERRALNDLDATTHIFHTLTATVATQLLAMREAMNGHPRAANYDGARVSGTTTIVDEHGTPMPARSDPTGEAAIRPDRASVDHRNTLADLGQLHDLVIRLADRLGHYTTHPATDKEQKDTEQANAVHCQSCVRTESSTGVPRQETVYKLHTTVKANLRTPYNLCSWCYTWVRDTGRLPTRP